MLEVLVGAGVALVSAIAVQLVAAHYARKEAKSDRQFEATERRFEVQRAAVMKYLGVADNAMADIDDRNERSHRDEEGLRALDDHLQDPQTRFDDFDEVAPELEVTVDEVITVAAWKMRKTVEEQFWSTNYDDVDFMAARLEFLKTAKRELKPKA